MKRLCIGLLVAAVSGATARAAEPVDYSALSDRALVERLAGLDNQQKGQEGLVLDDSFEATAESLAAACPPKPPTEAEMKAWRLGAPIRKLILLPPGPTPSPLAREIVRRGGPILPELISLLGDRRATRFLVASADPALDGRWLKGVMWGGFDDRYDPRQGATPMITYTVDLTGRFPTTYYARVGDLAYLLIGLIVNRDHQLAGYAPTSGAVIYSPIEAPSLARRTRSDWSSLKTMEDLKAALLKDALTSTDQHRADGAWVRLRFYFPAEYASLSGAAGAARETFERHVCDVRRPDYEQFAIEVSRPSPKPDPPSSTSFRLPSDAVAP